MTEDRPLESMVDGLAILLTTQVEQLRVLERTLRDQQQHIASRDVRCLLDCLDSQDRQLAALQQTEVENRRLMAGIASRLGLEPARVSLGDLSRALGGPAGADLEAHARAGREAVAIIRRINGDNRRLLTHALAFVQDLLAAAAGRIPAPTTYEASGNITARPQLDVLVDHRA
jgi:flagellar biosynthesis/type III secretory pathway chaperone